jgi:nicotinate-nucleotide adenylyltransferase
MNIVLFGGSFDPPHLGHLIVIQQAFELIDPVDELWLIPAYRHTFQKDLSPFLHRIKMAKALIMQLPRNIQEHIKLNTVECDKKLKGETYQTYALLKKAHPDHQFSFLMGSDQIPQFDQWGHYQELLEMMPFYVYPRPGFDTKISYPNMTLLQDKNQVITNISSTLIRQRLIDQLPVNHLIPRAIKSYIHTEKLYQK